MTHKTPEHDTPRILAACTAAMPFFIKTLGDLVGIDSATENIEGLNRKKDYLVAALQAVGAEVAVMDAAGPRSGTANIKGSLKGSGQAKILLICHYDTVWSAGEAAKRPFRIENDVAYGPGVADAQHSLAGMVAVLKIVSALQEKSFGELAVLMTADEEDGSIGSKELIMQEAARHDVVFSMEGGGADGDEIIISVRGNNRAVLTVKGRAAHSGENPEYGRNAGEELAHQMLQMRDLGNREKYTDINWTLGSFGSKYNMIPDSATATVNIRTALASEVDRVEKAMRERIANVLIPGCEVSLAFTRMRPAFEYTEKTEKLATAATAVFAELGRKLKLAHMGGASDANFACQCAPVLEGMGMGGGNWHALAEFLPLKTVPDRLYLLVRMVQELSTGKVLPLGKRG